MKTQVLCYFINRQEVWLLLIGNNAFNYNDKNFVAISYKTDILLMYLLLYFLYFNFIKTFFWS